MKRLNSALPLNNEVGALMCSRPGGETVFGPRAHGTHDNVDVPFQCPPDSKPFGVWHTHPHGVTQPSADDVRAARAFGLKKLCITVPQTGETDCSNL